MIYLNVTFKSMEDAKKLARELVEKKLAGIVSIAPISSVYPVNGQVDERDEALLKITTIDQKMQEVEDLVRERSDAKVPRIMAFSVHRINQEYKNWIMGHVA